MKVLLKCSLDVSDSNSNKLKSLLEDAVGSNNLDVIDPTNVTNLIELNIKSDVLFIDYNTLLNEAIFLKPIIKNSKFLVLMSNDYKDSVKAFKHSAFDFIDYQTLTAEELIKILFRVRTAILQSDNKNKIDEIYANINYNKKIQFKCKKKIEFILPEDILFIKSIDAYSCINLVNGRTLKTTCSLQKISAILPVESFFRLSRSVIINLHHIIFVDKLNCLCKVGYEDRTAQFNIPKRQINEKEISMKN